LKAIDARIATAMRGFGVPLSPEDLQTIAGFHRQFIDDGLSLQFHSAGGRRSSTTRRCAICCSKSIAPARAAATLRPRTTFSL
jgi:hypothetical protein